MLSCMTTGGSQYPSTLTSASPSCQISSPAFKMTMRSSLMGWFLRSKWKTPCIGKQRLGSWWTEVKRKNWNNGSMMDSLLWEKRTVLADFVCQTWGVLPGRGQRRLSAHSVAWLSWIQSRKTWQIFHPWNTMYWSLLSMHSMFLLTVKSTTHWKHLAFHSLPQINL